MKEMLCKYCQERQQQPPAQRANHWVCTCEKRTAGEWVKLYKAMKNPPFPELGEWLK